MAIGTPMGLKPGHTSSIRRIEAAMLSYQADMTLANNPFELGMDRLVDLDMPADFISKKALLQIRKEGISQKQVGLIFDGEALIGSNDSYWPIWQNDTQIGHVTSAVYSPRLTQNIALAMVSLSASEIGTLCQIEVSDGRRNAKIVPKPFYDPKKTLAAQS